jgi:hypothetical protein
LRNLRIPAWQTGGQAGIVEHSSLSRGLQYWAPLEREEHVFLPELLRIGKEAKKQNPSSCRKVDL